MTNPFRIFFSAFIALLLSCGEKKKADKSIAYYEDKIVRDTQASVTKSALEDSASLTSIKWLDSTVKDLGILKYEDSAIINFRFKNTGKKPLVVKGIRATCGCTVVDTLHKPVMPGKESKIKLKFYSHGQAAAIHEKHVYVITNTAPYAGTTLTFRVEIKD